MDPRLLQQREHLRRGFNISHQKVVLEVDFSGSLWGYTEITVIPTTKDLKTLYFHSRQCQIHTVTIAGHQADFTHTDPLGNISMGNSATEAADCHRHPELKRKLYSAMQEGDDGELAVALPREVTIRKEAAGSGASGLGNSGLVSEAATPEPQTPGPVGPEYAPLTVNIAYSLRNPVDGFEFVLPSDAYPHRVPHAYTTPSSPDSARCWVPCIDNPWEKCTWELEFVVPRHLEEREPGQEEEEEDNGDSYPTLVVCSGELVEQVAHPYNSNKTIFLFSQSTLTSVQHIAFAAGPFHLLSIPAELTAEDTTTAAAQPLMYAFCLPGQESMLATSTSTLRSTMSFYSTDFGSYPFGSYKVVFVDQLPTQRFDSSTLSLVTADLLHGDDAIEQAIETRHALAHALACQWVGVNIQPKNWSDLWLVNGLALYITGLFMRKLLGNNEYRFRLKKDMQRTVEWDVGGMPPICQPQILDPPDAATLPFINLKAPLVLHILDRKLGKSGTALGLSRVLPKLFLSAISGEMVNNTLSTHAFLRICRKVSGVDLRSFAEQWIYGSGCPSFGFSATFNRKKMAVEITMRQDCPAYKAMETSEVSKLLMKPVAFFEGTMTIRIHEADGTPYEHVLDIRSPFKRYEVPFNTKYKRVRRNTKRYLARQAAAQAAAEGDAEAAEAMGMVDMGFGLDVWEKEIERENWKVADWTEDDESVMSGATYEWIRMDADFEWIASLKFDQPDFMWVSQLQRDRDVVAQFEAIHALAEKPTAIVSSTLTKTVLVSNYYFRIRCEAALAIVTCAIKKLDFLGLFHLFKLFLRHCYEPEDANQDLFAHTYVPKPNDFSDFAEYFVRKSLVSAISRVRFETGKSPSIVRQFLIDQLRYNDNTANPYSDGLYICALISAAATSSVCVSPPERGELLPSEVRNELSTEDEGLLNKAVAEIDRYRSMDRLIPSTHNCVTVAALEFYMVLGVAGLIPNHPRVFFPLTREGHYTQVRIAAFDGLFLTKWYAPPIMRYIFSVMANDPSRVVRRHVARNACHSLALLVQMGEMKSGLKDTESLLIEEDGSIAEKSKELKKSEMDIMIKVLRKDREVGKNEALREFLMPVALAPDVDHEVRWCVLKLADLLIKPTEETPPTVKIHIPSTPVLETAPSLPTIKPPIKAIRPPIKASSTPTIKSPLVPFNAPGSRIKLPASPAVETPQTPSLSRSESKRSVVFATPALPPSVSNKNKLKPRPKIAQPERPEKPEKPAHVPKAQTSGMSLNDLKASRSALKKLKINKHAPCFLQPVDPIRDQAPSYFEIIKQPMDLSTMGAKLEAGMYKDRFSFQADFRLMVSNAKRYNMPGSYVHNEAIALEIFFEKQWTIINKTLEAASKHQASMQPPPPPATPRILPPVPKAFESPAPVIKPPKHARPPPPVTPAAAPVPNRPVIKLKVGGQSNHVQASPSSATPSAKPRKIKLNEPQPVDRSSPDAPPPPYVDDGSHDILQEVLAIEREKSEKRNRSEKVVKDKEKPKEKSKEKPVVNGTSNKRKKADTISEDDILALATPSKKERPTPPAAGPSSSSASTKPRMVIPATTKSAPTPEPTKSSNRPQESVPSKPSVPREIPKISLKGKEREKESSVPPGPPLAKVHKDSSVKPLKESSAKPLKESSAKPLRESSAKPLRESSAKPLRESSAKPSRESSVKLKESSAKPQREGSQSAMPINEKKCRELMKVIQRLPEAAIFARPVDPVLDGCPTYLDEIKHPMDFGTMLTKLGQNKYITMDDFARDMNRVFNNCRQFNPPGTYPVDCADAVEKVFKKEWPKALERKLSWTEKRGLQGVMNNLVKDPIAWVFLEPVDPVLLGIPTYFDVIPRKNARDLRTIRQKLDADKYDTVEAWEADLEQMIDNAITFNGIDSEVGQIAKTMQNHMHEAIDSWKSGHSKKRKDGDNKVAPQPTKKAKVA